MDTELEQHFLNKEKYSDNQIEELREKQYYVYRGYLNDFTLNDLTPGGP